MSNHPTRLSQRLDATGEVEILTHDPAVQHKAAQARLNNIVLDFVFWNGDSEEIIEGIVTSYRDEEPFRFTVKRQLKDTPMQPKIAETARQEREQGAKPQATSSGDTNVNAAGPHDKPILTTGATEGTPMLPTLGNTTGNDMAPGG